MLLIILFGVLTLLGIVMVILSHVHTKNYYRPYDGLMAPGWLITVIFGLVVIGMLICTIDLKSNFAYNEDRYNNLKAQVEMCDRDDIVTDDNLRNQVLEMNNDIAKHRQYSKNKWIGMYYSKHFGTLEPLQWKSNK